MRAAACDWLSSPCCRPPPTRQSYHTGIGDTGLEAPPGGAWRNLVPGESIPGSDVSNPADTLGRPGTPSGLELGAETVRTWNCRHRESQYATGSELRAPKAFALTVPLDLNSPWFGSATAPSSFLSSLGLASPGTNLPRGDRKVSCPRARSQRLGPDAETPPRVLLLPNSVSDQAP